MLGITVEDTMRIPTAQEAVIGGIWQTSSRAAKLAELKAELVDLKMDSLDQRASERQRLDLWLVDGLVGIDRFASQPILHADDNLTSNSNNIVQPLLQMLSSLDNHRQEPTSTVAATSTTSKDSIIQQQEQHWNQTQCKEFIEAFEDRMKKVLGQLPPDRCLALTRDYYEVEDSVENQLLPMPNDDNMITQYWDEAVLRWRISMTLAVAEYLRMNWNVWTTPTDYEKDRAAVQHRQATTIETVPAQKITAILDNLLQGESKQRMDLLWNLFDHDNDGLIDQTELQQLCQALVTPIGKALDTFVQEALQAAPMGSLEINPSKIMSWRQRRRERADRRLLTKMFRKTIRNHFSEELQMPHRIRCCYAWANKAHQNNRIDAVVVDEQSYSSSSSSSSSSTITNIMGRKRYVELPPRISLAEFRQVQIIHFPQLDNVGGEILRAFRDDLWIAQGKRRQNRELAWDCALFFTGVSIADYFITTL
jgi:hypothetical protein